MEYTDNCADVDGAVLLTADKRVVEAPKTAGNWNCKFEAFMVPVTAQKAEAGEDINTDKSVVVLWFPPMLFLKIPS